MATKIFGDFEWDEDKDRSNQAKHGVAFEEAISIFLDIDYMLVRDQVHVGRFLAVGFSSRERVLVVVHCERVERIRIISARRATRHERRTYEQRQTQ